MVPLLLIESEFTTVGSTDRHGSYVVVEEEIVAYPNPTASECFGSNVPVLL